MLTRLTKRATPLLLMVFVFAVPSRTYAEDARFHWSTRFSLSQEYNDNIYLDSTNAEDDWITTISQGLTMGIETEEVAGTVDFSIGYAFYEERPDHSSIRSNLNLSGFRDVPITENLVLDVDESLSISEEPVEVDELVASVRSTRDRYIRNRLMIRLAYQFGEGDQLYWGYGNTLLENTNPDLEDSQAHSPFIGLSYWFGLRHGIDLRLSYTSGEFDISSDFDDTRAGTVYTFLLNPSTNCNLSYSKTSKDFDEEEERDYEMQNMSLGISHQFDEGLSASASAGSYHQDVDKQSPESGLSWSVSVSKQSDILSASASAGFYSQNPEDLSPERGFRASLTLSKQFEDSMLSIDGNTGYTEQYFEAENLGFSRYKGTTVSYALYIMEDLTCNLTSHYREDKYLQLDSPREDKTWQTGISLSYPLLEWLTASLNLSHRDRDSTIEINDYRVNRILLILTAGYEGEPIDF